MDHCALITKGDFVATQGMTSDSRDNLSRVDEEEAELLIPKVNEFFIH